MNPPIGIATCRRSRPRRSRPDPARYRREERQIESAGWRQSASSWRVGRHPRAKGWNPGLPALPSEKKCQRFAKPPCPGALGVRRAFLDDHFQSLRSDARAAEDGFQDPQVLDRLEIELGLRRLRRADAETDAGGPARGPARLSQQKTVADVERRA